MRGNAYFAPQFYRQKRVKNGVKIIEYFPLKTIDLNVLVWYT